jgi:methylthioribose-1-phosphate isomerase
MNDNNNQPTSLPPSPVYDWLHIPTRHKRTVYFDKDKCQIILTNQPALPEIFQRVSCSSVQETAKAIRTMVVRGAPAIGVTGAYGMVLAAKESHNMTDFIQHKEKLDDSRPTAVNLTWATSRMLEFTKNLIAASKQSSVEFKTLVPTLLDEAERIADEDIEINLRMAKVGSTVVPSYSDRPTNISHRCNTGALATVDWGTALGVIHYCATVLQKRVHVWVDETRPRLQGSRLSAWELMKAKIPMHLIVDGVAGSLMRMGKVDIVLFGADRVARNGDVVNKIGTFPLSVTASEHGIPVYAVVPTSTIDLTCATGDDVEIEERKSEEVTSLQFLNGGRMAPRDVGCVVSVDFDVIFVNLFFLLSFIQVKVYNPAFDCTPYKYLTGIITEEGMCYPPYEQSLTVAKRKAEKRYKLKWTINNSDGQGNNSSSKI